MTATCRRFRGSRGVCIAARGPSAVNLSSGAPMLTRCNADGHDHLDKRRLWAVERGRFQVVDVIASTKPLTKLPRLIVSSEYSYASAIRVVSRGLAPRACISVRGKRQTCKTPRKDPVLNLIEQPERHRILMAPRSEQDSSMIDTFDIHLQTALTNEFRLGRTTWRQTRKS